MSPVSFIRKDQHPFFMRRLHDRPEVGTDAVISRIIDQDRHRVRILLDRFQDIVPLHSQRDPQPLVHIRVYIHRLRPAQHQSVDRTPVYIPGHDDLVIFLTAGQDHGLDCRRGAADHEKCVVRSERVRRQLLRLFDHGDRVAQIVQRLHGIHVNADAPLP